MLSTREATDTLDLVLAAACLQVSALHPPPEQARELDGALADQFAWLRDAAPFTHLAVCALLALSDGPAADGIAAIALGPARGERR